LFGPDGHPNPADDMPVSTALQQAAVLIAGIVALMPLLPAARCAVLLSASSRTVLTAVLVVEALASVAMLLGRMQSRRNRCEQKLAAAVMRGVRGGAW